MKDVPVSTETPVHVIEIYEGCLTIGTKKFPDDCISLTPEETEEVMRLLLVWKFGPNAGELLTEG